MNEQLKVRGFLLHLSHYDPLWTKENWRERFPFDLSLGLDLVDEMANLGFNTLIVDCEDAVPFKSHPELSRNYTMEPAEFKALVNHAKAKNIAIIPKLNFSQSSFYCHNDWMRPHNKWDDERDMFDSEEYWKIAFELIDDIAGICKPGYFHIGMDEDTDRSHRLFASAINTLSSGLAVRNIRTVIWRDSRADLRGEVFTEKHKSAEDKISKDIIPMIWKYDRPGNPQVAKHITNKGFELWGATGEMATPEIVSAWKELLIENGGTGLILTKWMPCNETNRQPLLQFLKRLAPKVN